MERQYEVKNNWQNSILIGNIYIEYVAAWWSCIQLRSSHNISVYIVKSKNEKLDPDLQEYQDVNNVPYLLFQ